MLQHSISNGNVLPDHTSNGQNFINSKTKFMKTTTILNVIVIMIFGFLLTGCQQDDTSVGIKDEIKVTDSQILKEIQFMKNEGMISSDDYEKLIRMEDVLFTPSDIQPMVGGDPLQQQYYSCPREECDRLMSRKMIQNLMKDKESLSVNNVSAKHRRSTYMFTPTGGTIVLRVQANVPLVWKNAINSAISDWNNQGFSVKFAAMTATDNIPYAGYVNVFMYDTKKGYKNLASASSPESYGGFGQFLYINTKYTYTTPYVSARRFAIAHELGHIIGLLHTDTTEGMNVYSSISCNGTTNYTDPNSVFKSLIEYNEAWNGFTPCDKNVLNYYW